MKRLLFAPALLLVLFAPAVRADAPKVEAPAKPVVVPFELLPSGHMAVMVKVNGEGPYRLIFDTGAPITLLDNKVAKDAGLLKGQAEPLFSIFGSRGEVKVKEIQVGDEAVQDLTAIVMDHPTVQAISNAFEKKLGGPIHGIVGFPFFARFKMTLDYQAKTVTLLPNGFKPPDVMQAMMAAIMAAGYVKPGETAKVVVKRGGKEMTLTVKPASGL